MHADKYHVDTQSLRRTIKSMENGIWIVLEKPHREGGSWQAGGKTGRILVHRWIDLQVNSETDGS